MAKRKTARSSGGKGAGTRAGAGRTRGSAKKPAARPRTAAKRAAKRTTAKRTTAQHTAKRTAAKRAPAKRATAKRATAKRTKVQRAAPKRARAAAGQKRRPAARRSITTSTAHAKMSRRASPTRQTTKKTAKTTKSASPMRQDAPKMARAPKTVVARKMPALNRERRTVQDDDLVPTPPSSLDLDRSASAVRTGRREMLERYNQHTETSPALTAGDVDADWESAYSVGDEAPGGDNPTPDQDIVDDIGRAVGVEYEDNEELKTEKKITDRDRHRWELDPASSEDYDDR